MLDCCLPILRVAEEGIVLHQACTLLTLSSGHFNFCSQFYSVRLASFKFDTFILKLMVCHQAACLARCNGAKVEVRQSGSFSVEDFREDVQQASQSEAEHLIVSYSRKQFLQTGEYFLQPPQSFRFC